MKQFFSRNITNTGRLIRFLIGCAFIIAGIIFCRADHKIFAALLILSGGFTWLEAVRGWCVMRACGIKTRW